MPVTPREREHTPAIPPQRHPEPTAVYGDPADMWADQLDDTELVTAPGIAEALGISVNTVHLWVHRKLLDARYIDDHGRPMYSLVQAHAVNLRMKLRGRRMAIHPNAEHAGWERPAAGQPWRLPGPA